MEILCGICGESHVYMQCEQLAIKKHVPDKKIPSKARLTLPNSLRVEKMSDDSYTVVAVEHIEKGTQFGPYDAKKLFTLNPAILFPLKIFINGDFFEYYYLDTHNENECSWMYFVAAASNIDEQNLICFQESSDIYYATIRDIKPGEFLKVWYSPYYAKKMNKNILSAVQNNNEKETLGDIDLNYILKKQQKIVEREMWTCKFCGSLERNVVKFSRHMLDHYAMQMKKACEICHRVFGSRKGLVKHLKIVHASKTVKNIEFNNDNAILASNEKSCTRDSLVGGPLLNDMLNDSLDNTNLLLQQTELCHFDISNIENQNILSESDNINLENLLNENGKDLEHFNFDIDETNEQFVCDICLKSFTKLRLLIMHLKKHTAQYTCLHCLKIFCRSENLKTHICYNNNNNDKVPEYRCNLCEKSFAQNKYLSRHVAMVHLKKYYCNKCEKQYSSLKEVTEHNCPKVPADEKKTYVCPICDKVFLRELYLKKHVKIHTRNCQEKEKAVTHVICEICAGSFESRKNLYQHMKSHSDPSLVCSTCNKKFHRPDVLENHMLTHEPPKLSCDICSRKFKLQKNLNTHKLIHLGKKQYKCPSCPKEFTQSSNFRSHVNKVHNKMCTMCKKQFPTAELLNAHKIEHITEKQICFKCDYCSKSFALRNSLNRHMKHHHSEENCKLQNVDLDKHNQNEEKINSDVQKLWPQETNKIVNIEKDNNEDLQKSNLKEGQLESLLDFNDIDMDFGIQSNLNEQEVCLSMPDLYENDQEITLGENAYIMDNGNIIQPTEQGKVTLYLLNPKI